MLNAFVTNEPKPPFDQPMTGKCWTCGKTVVCPFGYCEMKDDPPMGLAPMVSCPHPAGIDTFGKPRSCGTKVRMMKASKGESK